MSVNDEEDYYEQVAVNVVPHISINGEEEEDDAQCQDVNDFEYQQDLVYTKGD